MSRYGHGSEEDDKAALGMHRRVDVRAFLPLGSLTCVYFGTPCHYATTVCSMVWSLEQQLLGTC